MCCVWGCCSLNFSWSTLAHPNVFTRFASIENFNETGVTCRNSWCSDRNIYRKTITITCFVTQTFAIKWFSVYLFITTSTKLRMLLANIIWRYTHVQMILWEIANKENSRIHNIQMVKDGAKFIWKHKNRNNNNNTVVWEKVYISLCHLFVA